MAERFALQPTAVIEKTIASLSDAELYELWYDWRYWARPKQLAPAGDWSTWNIRAGRGFGKTRAGTGWVQERALEQPRWIALVAKTPADARDYMIEGPGGFLDKRGLNIKPSERPLFQSSKRRLTWPNGSWATIYSDEEPDQLRGFSGDTAWLDEFGKFKNPRLIWDNLAFGMREASSDRPRRLITTTPRPLTLLKEIEALPGTVTVRGDSYENRANLDPTWFAETILAYEGTQYGKQEIYGELLDPEEQGIVKRSSVRLWPYNKALPAFDFIIVSLDTAFTEKTLDRETYEPDPTAGGVWGLFHYHPHSPYIPVRQGERVKAGIMLLDAWTDYLGFPDLIARARKEMKVAYGRADAPLIAPLIGPRVDHGQGRRPDLLLIEDKGSGISLRQAMEREQLPAYAYNPGRLSKLQRLHLVSHVFEHGFVWAVESEDPNRRGQPKSWYEPWFAQLCAFAGEGSIEHDDHVDQTTQALRVMLDKHLIRVTPEETTVDPHAIVAKRSAFGRPLINPYAA